MNWTESQQQIFPIALLSILIIAITLGYLLKNKSDKIKNLPFLLITIVLIIFEIIKQIKSIYTGYTFWSLPLHYCSMFLFWFSLASFTKGNLIKVGHGITFLTGIGFFIAFLLNPSPIIGSATDNLMLSFSNFGNLHTFYYHFAIILFLALQITLKTYKPLLKDFKLTVIPFAIWMVIATICANLLNTNYTNLLTSNITFMENLRISYGYIFYLSSMFILFIGAMISMLALLTLSNKFILKRNTNKKN